MPDSAGPPVLDLRTRRPAAADGDVAAADRPAAGHTVPPPGELRFPEHAVVIVSGLPGSGKSTLIKRAVDGAGSAGPVHRLDSQDARERWARKLSRLPYGLYRPLVRTAHYTALWRALRSGGSVVVHDCGSLSWVRRRLARLTRRSGRSLHLLLLDVPAQDALAGQAARGRRVSRYAFGRHVRSVSRLISGAERGSPPRGCASVVLLDRRSADALHAIGFGGTR
nr:AAA family ATPase [Streptomyces meridianus]